MRRCTEIEPEGAFDADRGSNAAPFHSLSNYQIQLFLEPPAPGSRPEHHGREEGLRWLLDMNNFL